MDATADGDVAVGMQVPAASNPSDLPKRRKSSPAPTVTTSGLLDTLSLRQLWWSHQAEGGATGTLVGTEDIPHQTSGTFTAAMVMLSNFNVRALSLRKTDDGVTAVSDEVVATTPSAATHPAELHHWYPVVPGVTRLLPEGWVAASPVYG